MKYPVIDWELSLKLAANNAAHAKEFLSLLLDYLLNELPDLKNLYTLNKLEEMNSRIHHLQGALSYSGVSQLKYVTIALKEAVHTKINIAHLLKQFEHEIHQIQSEMYQYLT